MQRDGIGHVSATAYIVLCVCVWVGGWLLPTSCGRGDARLGTI